MKRLVLAVFVAVIAAACTPEGRRGVTQSRPARDASTSTVAADAGGDAGATTIADAGQMDGGPPGQCGNGVCDPDESCAFCTLDCGPCPARCGDNLCNGNETCETCEGDCGACPPCDPGFVLNGSGICVPNAPPPFDTRTEEAVCERWRADVRNVANEWTPTAGSTDPCDLGTLSQAAHDNAILRTNLYRWLVNLAPVGEDTPRLPTQQACAVMQRAMGMLDHTPPDTVPCYSAEAYAGSSSSNLAYGGGGLANSVDLYIGDRGVGSLGHRRWAFNPAMRVTAFGFKETFSCMYAFSSGGPINVDFVAWPPPGYVPAQSSRGTWSISSTRYAPAAATTVRLRVDGGAWTEVPWSDPGGNYGWGRVMAFDPPNATAVWRSGTTVEVSVTGTAGGTLEYTVRFVDCG